jgi:pSer/pThr/pTyr-binding forkhead associated (FHA) protein
MRVVFRLIVTRGEWLGERLHFPPGQYLFGRAVGCHIRYPRDSCASRQHCLLTVTEQGASVRDLQSRHGTWIGNEKITTERSLRYGDVLHIGPSSFRVEMTLSADPYSGPDAAVGGEPIWETFCPPEHPTGAG